MVIPEHIYFTAGGEEVVDVNTRASEVAELKINLKENFGKCFRSKKPENLQI